MWTDGERALLAARFDAAVPGSAAWGAVDYLTNLLTALDHDPPRIWAGGDGWIEPSPWERHAWTQRIEAWTATYRRILDGDDTAADRRTLYEHACEAAYGDPAYGGNKHGAAWQSINFPPPQYPPFFVEVRSPGDLSPTTNAMPGAAPGPARGQAGSAAEGRMPGAKP